MLRHGTAVRQLASLFPARRSSLLISLSFWLRVPDYFLREYLKGTVYQNKPQIIDALKANITEEIQKVTADVLARTFQNMARRVQSCLEANGGHFQHML